MLLEEGNAGMDRMDGVGVLLEALIAVPVLAFEFNHTH